LIITMLLGGLWHGAGANYLLWGLWQGGGIAAYRLYCRQPLRMPSAVARLVTLAFILYGWLLFRSGSADQVYTLTTALADWSMPLSWKGYVISLAAFIVPLAIVEIWQRRGPEFLAPWRLNGCPQSALYAVLIIAIQVFWEHEASPFIYFQF
jgi:alginate O-acetyltransferase complex protein AlgI